MVDADTDFLLRLEAAHPEGMDMFRGRLHEIQCPTLFTCSIQDDLVPFAAPQMFEMAQQVAGSWYFTSNASAHPFMWTCPDTFRAVARDFLSTLK